MYILNQKCKYTIKTFKYLTFKLNMYKKQNSNIYNISIFI